MSDELFRLRDQIDAIDGQLLKLLSERAGLAQAVGQLKNGEGIYRAEREAQVVRRMRDANPGPLSSDTVERLFREIISACRELEQPLRSCLPGPARHLQPGGGAQAFRPCRRRPALYHDRRGIPCGGNRQGRLLRGTGGELHRRRGVSHP